VTDQEEIKRLIVSFSYIIDEKQWDRIDELFTETGSFEVAGSEISMQGAAEIKQAMQSVPQPLSHYISNILIDVVEGADTAKAQVKVFAPRADGTISIGKYNDDFVRTADGWRFQKRYIVNAARYWHAAIKAD
jgi:hypothetical protein